MSLNRAQRWVALGGSLAAALTCGGCGPSTVQVGSNCAADADCPAGFVCDADRTCVEGTRTGVPCRDHNECPLEQRCLLDGDVGNCAALLPDTCRRSAHCVGELICTAEAGEVGDCVECLGDRDCATGVCLDDGTCSADGTDASPGLDGGGGGDLAGGRDAAPAVDSAPGRDVSSGIDTTPRFDAGGYAALGELCNDRGCEPIYVCAGAPGDYRCRVRCVPGDDTCDAAVEICQGISGGTAGACMPGLPLGAPCLEDPCAEMYICVSPSDQADYRCRYRCDLAAPSCPVGECQTITGLPDGVCM